jgi:hypothetical protein
MTRNFGYFSPALPLVKGSNVTFLDEISTEDANHRGHTGSQGRTGEFHVILCTSVVQVVFYNPTKFIA